MATVFRALSLIVVCHGIILFVFGIILPTIFPYNESISKVVMFLLFMPAMILAAPLSKVLWSLELINTPGWMTWPKPLGFLVVYLCWSLGLLLLSLVVSRKPKPTN